MPMTTMPAAPIRTAAGENELRHRTRKLGQRHRTVLLLIDGRRTLDELLSLAQQAGAAVSHFEELVELGLVELPAQAPAEPQPALGPAEEASTEGVQREAATPGEAEAAVPAVEPEPDQAPLASPVDPLQAPIRNVGVAAPSEPVVATPLAQPVAPPVPTIHSDSESSAEETAEERLLQQVRDLLIDTLRIDSPLFGARTFFRVRSAQSTSELIDLVWEIEDHLTHARHTRDELISLQRARELLGMGNTRVAGETKPGRLPE
jgi:hypothetical protein